MRGEEQSSPCLPSPSNIALERTGHTTGFFSMRVSVACGPPLTAGVRRYAESIRTHTRIARPGGHMNIDITTTTVFALFYAIMFGGMLNRLSDWSAFAW